MKSKRILVTGGAGFIGSHLVDELIQRSYEVVVIDNLSTGKRENVNPEARLYEVDIGSPRILEIFQNEKPQILFHLAARTSVRKSITDPIGNAKVNILSSLNLIESFIKVNSSISDCKFIFSSTGGAIYGDADVIPTPEDHPEIPLSPYGVSKLSFEKYLNYYHEMFRLPFVSLRYANVYGPRQKEGVIPVFCNQILGKEKVTINGDGKQTRDFVFVKDVVEANMVAMEKEGSGIFNISTGKETDVNTVFSKIKNLMNSKCKAVYNPLKHKEQLRSCLDNKKAQNGLKWAPKYDFNRGLEKTVRWFEENYNTNSLKDFNGR
ncbi:MAG: NAD-dependent epimerase/dehydratase family protein [Candidatus Nealsonbacteria bacterium]